MYLHDSIVNGLRIERRDLLHSLEQAAMAGLPLEHIVVNISENRGRIRERLDKLDALLASIREDALTRPMSLDDELPPLRRSPG